MHTLETAKKLDRIAMFLDRLSSLADKDKKEEIRDWALFLNDIAAQYASSDKATAEAYLVSCGYDLDEVRENVERVARKMKELKNQS